MPKAYVFTRYGGPEVEAFAEVERPVPGPGQVLVAVRAAGVNPVDWKQRDGHLAQIAPVEFPAVFGREVSGRVQPLCRRPRPGRRSARCAPIRPSAARAWRRGWSWPSPPADDVRHRTRARRRAGRVRPADRATVSGHQESP